MSADTSDSSSSSSPPVWKNRNPRSSGKTGSHKKFTSGGREERDRRDGGRSSSSYSSSSRRGNFRGGRFSSTAGKKPSRFSKSERFADKPKSDAPKKAPSPEEIISLANSELLKNVSRTFFISIKLLPAPLKEPIALGYLLARALDTIADAPAAELSIRLNHLHKLLAMVKAGSDPDHISELEKDLIPHQTHQGEKKLLSKLKFLLGRLDHLSPGDRWDLTRAVLRIGYGQELDLRKFEDHRLRQLKVAPHGRHKAINCLATKEETLEYADLVAGSAGEFWTRLCERHLPNYSTHNAEQMIKWGRGFGQGLQLVNILRDMHADLTAGRCYLPEEELKEFGLSAEDLLRDPKRAAPLINKWIRIAAEYLDSGWNYVSALNPKKLRYSCALPLILGIRTLALLAKHSPLESGDPVKITRSEVRSLMLSIGVGMLAKSWLGRLYNRDRQAISAL